MDPAGTGRPLYGTTRHPESFPILGFIRSIPRGFNPLGYTRPHELTRPHGHTRPRAPNLHVVLTPTSSVRLSSFHQTVTLPRTVAPFHKF